ncbi:TraR/DksA family transcriptional regulator [Moraxella sp. FZLJ2107]|uniref:TraR/DksA family transcriptional regulator n=1 Tax=unclassified Moraxella TaxID=2685852 RepID=UPI00209C3249|nr:MULTISPECIES: TraR/DksA family transcriptional regulator [unclassified Moraxella]USZ13899.1 TraR/DksA family transcriptional regulator [Moraxella sp. FZFQ2102]UTO04355.1 TraR/DksA family transcriptional regulator [Moraxella sp. FZLJ2107]UTO23188.1 TraR/DksA family transcriptional regulator [Moraxella sp. FZLJ2109]
MKSVEHYQAALLSLKQEYQARIEKIKDRIAHPEDNSNQDWDDQAVAATRDEMRMKLVQEAEEGLTQVNAALRRIEEGGYGVCSECGEDIEEGRLDAVPFATLCVAHAK